MTETPQEDHGIVDLPKVAQMFDTGWIASVFRSSQSEYLYEATATKVGLAHADVTATGGTPEHALTRLAYKIRGESV